MLSNFVVAYYGKGESYKELEVSSADNYHITCDTFA